MSDIYFRNKEYEGNIQPSKIDGKLNKNLLRGNQKKKQIVMEESEDIVMRGNR